MKQECILASVLVLLALAGCGAGTDSSSTAATASQLRQGGVRMDAGPAVNTTFSGNLSQYTISNASLTVTDNVSGQVQAVPARALLQFADATVSLDVDDGIPGQMYRLYQAAFNRVPDLAGLGAQINGMNNGLSLEQIAQNFIDSREFSDTYGALNNTAFVTQLYANVLKRAPDAAGLAFHVGNLEGTNPGGRVLSRAIVLFGFSESAENKALVADKIRNGIEYIPFGSSAPSTPATAFTANYNGSLSGGDSGTLALTVDANGALIGALHSAAFNVDMNGVTGIAPGGRFVLDLSGGGHTATLSGSFNLASGLATGSWTYGGSTAVGTFFANKKVQVVLRFPQVQAIINQRCVSCHSASLANGGVRLDTEALIRGQAARINQVAVQSTIMPQGNVTGMTADERAIIGKWISDGTPP
ncbi:DUF4214 domain-containing protein [Duganella sp. CY15W]|uniref:DUF4214 domain-containing protein n=1 Tax=Duganella sp. CY15W TaxID=2692172 RepID=UPI0013713D85|nr:DUF4214 domain-containing protein [Duganella sp. CY15W]MYM32614.1 DUF4214 domain-containing protein [Duganella sp. CY15W]